MESNNLEKEIEQIRERNKESTVGNHRHLPYFISTCRRTFVFTCKGLPT